MSPGRLSAKPSATVWRPQPKRVSASKGVPPQYFTAISASKARRVGPLICDAARRRSAICDGLSDGWHASVASCMPMIGPLEWSRVHLPEGSSAHAYSSIVISFPEIALAQSRDSRIKSSPETIAKALEGDYRPEHRFTLTQSLELYDFTQQHIAACDQEIERVLATFDSLVDPAEHPLPPPTTAPRRPQRHEPAF